MRELEGAIHLARFLLDEATRQYRSNDCTATDELLNLSKNVLGKYALTYVYHPATHAYDIIRNDIP